MANRAFLTNLCNKFQPIQDLTPNHVSAQVGTLCWATLFGVLLRLDASAVSESRRNLFDFLYRAKGCRVLMSKTPVWFCLKIGWTFKMMGVPFGPPFILPQTKGAFKNRQAQLKFVPLPTPVRFKPGRWASPRRQACPTPSATP